MGQVQQQFQNIIDSIDLPDLQQAREYAQSGKDGLCLNAKIALENLIPKFQSEGVSEQLISDYQAAINDYFSQ